jgi:hypothetical protein
VKAPSLRSSGALARSVAEPVERCAPCRPLSLCLPHLLLPLCPPCHWCPVLSPRLWWHPPPLCQIMTNADFLKSFPQTLDQITALESWLVEAACHKLLWGHLCMAIKTAGHTEMLVNEQFLAFVCNYFPSAPSPPTRVLTTWQ